MASLHDDGPPVANPDLLSNMYGAYSTWVLRHPSSQVVPDSDIILIDSGVPSRELNIGFLLSTQNASAAINKGSRFFGERSRPWRLEAALHLKELVDPIAKSVGLTEYAVRPGFTLVPEELKRSVPTPQLAIEKVDSAEKGHVFLRSLMEGFSIEPSPAGVPPEVRFSLPDLTRYLGLVDGVPVATAAVYTHCRVAGIYAVSTVPKARRRGYGRAVTERAVLDGFSSGCTVSFLQSTVMGRPMYEGMGYRWAFDRSVWTSREPGR